MHLAACIGGHTGRCLSSNLQSSFEKKEKGIYYVNKILLFLTAKNLSTHKSNSAFVLFWFVFFSFFVFPSSSSSSSSSTSTGNLFAIWRRVNLPPLPILKFPSHLLSLLERGEVARLDKLAAYPWSCLRKALAALVAHCLRVRSVLSLLQVLCHRRASARLALLRPCVRHDAHHRAVGIVLAERRQCSCEGCVEGGNCAVHCACVVAGVAGIQHGKCGWYERVEHGERALRPAPAESMCEALVGVDGSLDDLPKCQWQCVVHRLCIHMVVVVGRLFFALFRLLSRRCLATFPLPVRRHGQ
mmetsp:Transcript_5222/g.13175  ORF Transcript_5222/g.13175 Transcript_5222/m.13175 type:complete len:300 (-) Transcript_5222:1509-2408(-)